MLLPTTEQLRLIGFHEFISQHNKLIEEFENDTIKGSATWDKAVIEALIYSVSKMMEENNVALLMQLKNDQVTL